MTRIPAASRIRLAAAALVAAVIMLAPWGSTSAQQQENTVLRIAMRVKDLPLGQLVVATGQAQAGGLTCHGVALNSPRVFLISGKEPPDDRQLMYFEQGSSAGRKWDVTKKLNDEPCPGPDGVPFYLYEMTAE